MNRTKIQSEYFASFAKRLNFSENTTNPLKFYLQITTPTSQIIEHPKPLPIQKPNAVTLLRKSEKRSKPFKKLIKVLDGHGKLNFHSEMIYIRKNLFNPQVKNLNNLTQTTQILSNNISSINKLAESSEEPQKTNENCLNARKLNIFEIKRKQDKEATKPQKTESPTTQTNSNLFLSKKHLAKRKASEIQTTSVSLITKRPLQCNLPRLSQKLRLSPSVSFSNDIIGWV